MRRSDMATILFLLSGFVPLAAFAQQRTPELNQSGEARTQQTPQPVDQDQRQMTPAQPPSASGKDQSQNTPSELTRVPQRSDQNPDRQPPSVEDARAKQSAEERRERDRMRERQMGHVIDEDEDRQRMDRNWGRDYDDINRNRRYGSTDRSEEHYFYQVRPRTRVKTCIEYENGDEFCRYRD